MLGKKNIRIHYFGFQEWGIRTDKFHLHIQKPCLSKIFQLFEYFDQNHTRFKKKKRRVEEIFNTKNQANSIKLVCSAYISTTIFLPNHWWRKFSSQSLLSFVQLQSRSWTK